MPSFGQPLPQATQLLADVGQAFSAGADIKHLSQSTPMKVREFSRFAVTVTNQIENLGKVVVAALY